jgi:transposase
MTTVRTDYRDGQVIFTITQDPENCRCSACGSRDVISRGHVDRRFRRGPIGPRPTAVTLRILRVECRACSAVRQVRVPFADSRRSYTRSFERYALELSCRMTIRDVAHQLDVGWDLIKHIQKRDLSRRYAKPKHLRSIAIDEIAVASGHRYLTVVGDLDNGAVVFVGDGKGADALKPFCKRLPPSGAKIEAVAMDLMSFDCRNR